MSDTTRGMFVPTTRLLNLSRIYDMNLNNLLINLYKNVNSIATTLNRKTNGTHALVEFLSGNRFFPNPDYSSKTNNAPDYRSEFRLVINFGALPNSASTKSVAHGLTFNSKTLFTGVYGVASDTTSYNYIPIPYATSTAANIVEINVDSTNVNIKVGKDMSAFDKVIVILSYLRH